VVIDPGRAFGTGAHGSTRAALALLQELEPGPALDLGCGSGVLSIAAAKLGFAPVRAVDVDAVALEVSAANAAANEVYVEIGAELRPAELAVMNIALDVVERTLPELPVDRAITSGYLERDEPQVGGWHAVTRRVRDGWAADLLVRD
jgi:ribosomal protein L11 methyltransferase